MTNQDTKEMTYATYIDFINRGLFEETFQFNQNLFEVRYLRTGVIKYIKIVEA